MTNNTSFVQQSFERAFEAVEKVAYNPEWKRGDYLNGACDYELAAGKIVGSTAEGADARRMIIIGTISGTVVIFERFTPGTGSAFVLVSNAPSALRFILPSGSLDDDAFQRAVNPYQVGDNLGSRLQRAITGKKSVVC